MTFTRVTDGHQCLYLELVAGCDLHTTGIVVTRCALIDVLENALVPRLKTYEKPPKSRSVHGLRLLIGEEFRLHEASQAEIDSESSLQIGNPIHQLHHRSTDVQLVVVKHEPRVTVVTVEFLDLAHDGGRASRPNLPQRRRVAPSTKAATEWAAKLRNKTDGSATINLVAVAAHVHEVPCGKR